MREKADLRSAEGAVSSRRGKVHFAACLFFPWLLLAPAIGYAAETAPPVRAALPPAAGPVLERAARLLEGRIAERCDPCHETRLLVALAVDPALQAEEYRIGDAADGSVEIAGGGERAVLYGVGHFLRASRYDGGRFVPTGWRGRSRPECGVRGIYFATHFGNYYVNAPPEEVDRVIEECALWGGNQLAVWFDMHHFESFEDPAARKHLARLRHFQKTARGVGMKFGLTFLANEAFAASPKELRADGRTGRAHYGVELCPSKPGGLEMIGRFQAQVLDAFEDVDFIWSWPYDQGGCACAACAPWGSNGFLRASEQLAALYRRRRPGGDLWLSTWLLDYEKDQGEYRGLWEYVREKRPAWITGFLFGTHSGQVPESFLDARNRPCAGRYPLAAFPEISMYAMHPWGAYGAHPLPGHCAEMAGGLRGKVAGGWPYSEGIYEDLNKFLFARLFWSFEQPADGILAEYADYYFGPRSAADAVRLFRWLEKTSPRGADWKPENLGEADEAWEAAKAIDRRMPRWAKTSWRWRLVYIRAAIDHVLKTRGAATAEGLAELRPLLDELRRIQHISPETQSMLNIPPLPEPPPNDRVH